MNNFPQDVNVEVPIVVDNGVERPGLVGSELCIGTFANGKLTFAFPEGAVNIGGYGSFFNFFAIRG